MNRITVSEGFRFEQTNAMFNMVFMENANTIKAFEAIKNAISDINYENGFAALWIQDLSDGRTENSFEIESILECDEFTQYIPAMLKAVAEVLPATSFKGSARYDSVKCFCVDEYEFSYSARKLHIKETFMDDDCGYFCPDCGYQVALPFEEFDSDEVECDDCEETIKLADLEYVPPMVNKETIEF